MIEVSQLTKRFGSHTVVNNLSFNVAPGEVLGFLGPNGAGKSTTMKMLTGFLQADSGSVRICGEDVEKDPIAVKRMIGYLPEGAPCYSDMTVLQFLRFIADVRGFKGEEKQQHINDVVQRLELQSVLHQVIDTLSKGFKRRVGLAQAIIHDPKVLILDEPTDGLDPNQKHQVRELIANLSKDKIVIISTHILEEVSAVCSRAIIIDRGEIVADATPAELQTQSRYYRAVTLRMESHVPTAINNLTAIDEVETVEIETVGASTTAANDEARDFVIFPKPGKDVFAAVNDLVQQQQWQVRELTVDSGRLDDVFRKVTVEREAV